jgi:hypothetical protein
VSQDEKRLRTIVSRETFPDFMRSLYTFSLQNLWRYGAFSIIPSETLLIAQTRFQRLSAEKNTAPRWLFPIFLDFNRRYYHYYFLKPLSLIHPRTLLSQAVHKFYLTERPARIYFSNCAFFL